MTEPKKRTDWEAVERDYRATNLTLRELADKHGCKHSAIANQAKRKGWTRDLDGAVKAATTAALIEHAVTKNVTKCEQGVTTVVLAMAEVNKQVLLSHRDRLTELADVIDFAKGVVRTQGATITDIKEAVALVQAVNGLATATKTLIEKERENYKLNDASAEVPKIGNGYAQRIELDFSDVVDVVSKTVP